HCSSGEFEYAKPVIKILKEKYPLHSILVTYFTTSYKSQIEKNPLVDFSQPLPWDLPGPIASFLKQYKPQCLLLARSEIWPELVHQVSSKKIPILIFSANKKQISPGEKFLYPLVKKTYSKINDVYCVSKEQISLYKTLGAPSVKEVGDTRYDQVIQKLHIPSPLVKTHSIQSNKKIFIAGSTWKEDERVIQVPLVQLFKEKTLAPIIAPHEPSKQNLIRLKNFFEKQKVPVEFFSQISSWSGDSLLLIDQIGVLASLYPYAHLAFVGGSFKKKVHSVMEPLAAGVPVLVGPYYQNSPEACLFKKFFLNQRLCYISSFNTSQEFYNLVQTFFQEKQPCWKNSIQQEIQKRTGASLKVVQWVQHHLKEPPQEQALNPTHSKSSHLHE
ncbi:MAG: hypothetical protein D6797_09730, partial [Bdellovibrio sp.]